MLVGCMPSLKIYFKGFDFFPSDGMHRYDGLCCCRRIKIKDLELIDRIGKQRVLQIIRFLLKSETNGFTLQIRSVYFRREITRIQADVSRIKIFCRIINNDTEQLFSRSKDL